MMFGGIVVAGDEVKQGLKRGPLAGATARLETSGDIEQRFTATRLAVMGPFALAFKKKNDKRTLYLTVEGDGFGYLVEVKPKKEKAARAFVAKFNGAAAKATAARTPLAPVATAPPPPAPPTVPPAWHADPHGRHQYRWWDGTRWTDQVADDGTQSTDPT